MRRRLIPVILLALALPGAARAHVTVSPERVAPGDERLLTFVVPNETQNRVVDSVLIGMNGLRLVGVQRMPGWRHELTNGYFLAWSGGRIAPRELARFTVSVDVPARLRAYTFDAVLLSHDRRVGEYHPRIAIGPPPASPRASGDGAVAKIALGVAVAALAVAVGTFFIVLAIWLRGPRAL
jgi:hypothetical protein